MDTATQKQTTLKRHRPSLYSLWELFPIGAPVNRTNLHHRKAGPGRRCRRYVSRLTPPVKRLAPAMGIGNWKGERYLSYMAHDAMRRWRSKHLAEHTGPGEYLRRQGIDTSGMDEADVHLCFILRMQDLQQQFG